MKLPRRRKVAEREPCWVCDGERRALKLPPGPTPKPGQMCTNHLAGVLDVVRETGSLSR